MPLCIRVDRVMELAIEVAALQRSTVTDVVRDAPVLRLNELQDGRDERRRRIDAVLAQFDAEPDLAPGFRRQVAWPSGCGSVRSRRWDSTGSR